MNWRVMTEAAVSVTQEVSNIYAEGWRETNYKLKKKH